MQILLLVERTISRWKTTRQSLTFRVCRPNSGQLPHALALMPRDTFRPSPAQVAQSRQTAIGWETFFAMLAAAFWIVEIVDVARREFPGEATKIGWVLIVVLLNFLGAGIYYFFGKSQGEIPVQNG